MFKMDRRGWSTQERCCLISIWAEESVNKSFRLLLKAGSIQLV